MLKAPPKPEISPLLRPLAFVRVRVWLPRMVLPAPVMFLRPTGLVAAAIERLPLFITPLEGLMDPPATRARVEPVAMVVAPE